MFVPVVEVVRKKTVEEVLAEHGGEELPAVVRAGLVKEEITEIMRRKYKEASVWHYGRSGRHLVLYLLPLMFLLGGCATVNKDLYRKWEVGRYWEPRTPARYEAREGGAEIDVYVSHEQDSYILMREKMPEREYEVIGDIKIPVEEVKIPGPRRVLLGALEAGMEEEDFAVERAKKVARAFGADGIIFMGNPLVDLDHMCFLAIKYKEE